VIINQIDLGGWQPWLRPQVGQELGSELVYGGSPAAWAKGARVSVINQIDVWVRAWQTVGGNAALSLAAIRFLIKELEELAANPRLQPVYVQWTASADPAASFNGTDPHDGWYVIEDVEPDYSTYLPAGVCKTRISMAAVAPSSALVSLYYGGGVMSTSYSGALATQPLLGAPVGTSNPNWLTRVGSEGSIPTLDTGSPTNPYPLQLSGTISNWWLGGVRCYDSLTAGGGNPPTNGTAVNANWVPVWDRRHSFVGDIILTNGLIMLQFRLGSATPSPLVWLWNTALATPAWQGGHSDFGQFTDGGALYSVLGIRVEDLSFEAGVVTTTSVGSDGNMSRLRFRMERASYHVTLDFTPLNYNNTTSFRLDLEGPANSNSLAWNDLNYNISGLHTAGVVDQAVSSNGGATVPTDYGFWASFIKGQTATYPLLRGWLYQNPPAANGVLSTNDSRFPLSDTTSLAAGATRRYGFFVVPFPSLVNYQGEAENWALSGGFVSATDAGASGGSSAKLPSGTAAGAIAVGTSNVPIRGSVGYILALRMRVTAQNASSNQIQWGLWDVTAGSWSWGPVGSTPNQIGTSYAWYVSTAGVGDGNIPAGHTIQFRVDSVGLAAATTDFWIDEACLLPWDNAPATGAGPADLWFSFMQQFDKRWVRG
jgi:hypothetical protein